jgi:hypothetical protein
MLSICNFRTSAVRPPGRTAEGDTLFLLATNSFDKLRRRGFDVAIPQNSNHDLNTRLPLLTAAQALIKPKETQCFFEALVQLFICLDEVQILR